MAKVTFAGKTFQLPQSKPLRIGLGVLFVLGGVLGFLPIVGFWMIPVGLLILSADSALLRKQTRKLSVWWGRRRERTNAKRRMPTSE